MERDDDFTEYHQGLLEGRYDCVDRIVLNGYFPLGQQGGGFRYWWRQLTGSDGPSRRSICSDWQGASVVGCMAMPRKRPSLSSIVSPECANMSWRPSTSPAIRIFRVCFSSWWQGAGAGLGGQDLQERHSPSGEEDPLALCQPLSFSPD